MADNMDKFIKTPSSAPPSKLAAPIGQNDTVIQLESLEGWSSTTDVVVVIDRFSEDSGELTPELTEVVLGSLGPNGLEDVVRGVGGTRKNHPAGAVAEVTVAASAQWNRAMDALIGALGQDGKIKESAFEKDEEENYAPVLPGRAVIDRSIAPKKMDWPEFNSEFDEEDTDANGWAKTIGLGGRKIFMKDGQTGVLSWTSGQRRQDSLTAGPVEVGGNMSDYNITGTATTSDTAIRADIRPSSFHSSSVVASSFNSYSGSVGNQRFSYSLVLIEKLPSGED